MLDPLKFDGKKNRDLAPPPRAKFLHFRPTREPTLQERMDEVVYPMAEVVKPALNPSLAQAELEQAQSRGDFAWGSDRIAHELATKLDQFVRRPEDAVRKLLSAVGTEHRFESKGRNAIAVTPKNLSGLCNRFGLACNDGQARRRCARAPLTAHTSAARTPLPPAAGTPLIPRAPPHGGTPFPMYPTPHSAAQAEQIFERHRLPRDGCSVQTLSTNLLNPQVDTAQLARAEGRRALGSPYASSTRFSFAQGPRTPRVSKVTLAPAADPHPSPSPSPSPDADADADVDTSPSPSPSPSPNPNPRTRSRWPSCRALCPAGSHRARARPHSHGARARPPSTAGLRRVWAARPRCARRAGGERCRCAPSGTFSYAACGTSLQVY